MEYIIVLDIQRQYGKRFTTVYHHPDGSVFITANKTELKEKIAELKNTSQISNVYAIANKAVKV